MICIHTINKGNRMSIAARPTYHAKSAHTCRSCASDEDTNTQRLKKGHGGHGVECIREGRGSGLCVIRPTLASWKQRQGSKKYIGCKEPWTYKF